MGKQVPAGRSQASEMPSEFQPHEMGQSHFQERNQRMDSFPGEAASRNCNHRLLEPAGAESVANGWQCRGLCCQLASAAVAFCHSLVPSTCGGLAAAGPSGERWKGERREEGQGPGNGFGVLLSEAVCCECPLSRSNSSQINWAGYGGIWLLHRATKGSECAGAPAGSWNRPSAARHNYFQQCLSATET